MAKIKAIDKLGNEVYFEEDEFIDRTGVYGIAVDSRGILLVYDKTRKMWDLPGGGIEEGEDKQEGLKREIKEETGFEVADNMKLVDSYIEYYKAYGEPKPWKSERNYYLVKIIGGELAVHKNEDPTSERAEFFKVEEVDHIPMREKIKEIIKKSLEI